MKRIFAIIAGALAFTGIMNADNDRVITFDQLPEKAKTFITTNFADQKVSYAKEETDIFEVTYEVVFSQGTKIEFDSKGEWKEIDCKYTMLDEKFVPDQIKAYVAKQWPDVKFVKIDKGRYGYEVELTNGLELTFDKNFNLIEIDD